MEFNKVQFGLFKQDVKLALKEVEEKYGVSVSCGNINYSQYDFTLQLVVTKSDSTTDGMKERFAKECVFYGFQPEDYERVLVLNGKTFKLIGFNLNSPKNCCRIVRLDNNGEYKCSAAAVKVGFKEASK